MPPAASQPTIQLPSGASGVLPRRFLLEAIAAGVIAAEDPVPESNVQPASLDLRLGEVAYRMRFSFLPGTDTVERKLRDHVIDELDLRDGGAVLETNQMCIRDRAPTVSQLGAAILVPGVVVTVEPGVYLPGLGGVRIEDTLVVTEDGSRSLTRFTKDVAA